MYCYVLLHLVFSFFNLSDSLKHKLQKINNVRFIYIYYGLIIVSYLTNIAGFLLNFHSTSLVSIVMLIHYNLYFM